MRETPPRAYLTEAEADLARYGVRLDAAQAQRMLEYVNGHRVSGKAPRDCGRRVTMPRRQYGRVPVLKVSAPKRQPQKPKPFVAKPSPRKGPFGAETRARTAAGQRERRDRERRDRERAGGGVVYSDETRARMRAASQRRWEREKA